jgi:hypothetical protein
MTLRAADFKHGDTEFGIFYPTGYVLAVFPDAAQADRAVAALRARGFTTGDLVVATGAEVLAYSREMRADPGLVSRFERFLADLFGGEATLADELVTLAERGHAFVAIHAPDEAATTRAAEAVRALAPVVLRKFDALTFTDLR